VDYIQLQDLIFSDGFESGDLSGWTSNLNDLGDLSVTTAAAMVGVNGLQAVIDDNTAIYVTDETPNAEKRYRARFYFDPNGISMSSGDAHSLFIGYMGTGTYVVTVEFRYTTSGGYQLRTGTALDSNAWSYTSWYPITDDKHAVEIDWQASNAPLANSGSLAFWIDGVQKANLANLDTDTRQIDRVQLGAVYALDTGTRGTEYFDAFESRRSSYIGP
jgi:hypothetical protein